MKHCHLLQVKQFDNKKRYGVKQDGGYVIGTVDTKYDCYISAGISNEESFTRDFLKGHPYIPKSSSFAFDGTIKDYPWQYTRNITFVKKNINKYNDSKNTDLKVFINKYDNIFLSIDIEGGEYPWLLSLTEQDLSKFGQILIEFHGICGNDWGSKYDDKVKALEKLSKTHYIIHAHGNNHGPVKNNIPNVLELTYLNKKFFTTEPPQNVKLLPIKNLDYPNARGRKEIILHNYPFVNLPRGTWRRSSRNHRIENGYLITECRNNVGRYIKNKVKFNYRKIYSNINGKLV